MSKRVRAVFEYFTRSLQRAMVLADEETRELGHNYTGTERLLLGLLREQEGAAVRVLEALNVAPDNVREQVVRVVGSEEAGTGARRSLTPRRALRSASDEALRLGHEHVDAGHVLLGFVGEFERVAARVLCRLVLDPDVIHREVARASGSGRRPSEAPDTRQTWRAPRRSGRVWSGSWSRRAAAFRTRSVPPRPLRVDLRYSYEAGGEDDLDKT